MNCFHTIGTTVALMSVAAPGAVAQKMTDIKISQAVASFAFLPISYARAAGLYKAEGLSVTQIKTRGDGSDLLALMSGGVQFNANSGTDQIGVQPQRQCH